jgi:hypothetical protein
MADAAYDERTFQWVRVFANRLHRGTTANTFHIHGVEVTALRKERRLEYTHLDHYYLLLPEQDIAALLLVDAPILLTHTLPTAPDDDDAHH